MTRKLPMVSMHFFLPMDIIEQLDKKVDDQTFPTRSESLRGHITGGIELFKIKEIMKDPQKKTEFAAKIEAIATTNNVEQFVDTLDDDELEALSLYVNVAKNKRTQQMVLSLR